MSSMFKKRGGLAFKPKAPAIRRAPAATTATSSIPKVTETQDSSDKTEATAPLDVHVPPANAAEQVEGNATETPPPAPPSDEESREDVQPQPQRNSQAGQQSPDSEVQPAQDVSPPNDTAPAPTTEHSLRAPPDKAVDPTPTTVTQETTPEQVEPDVPGVSAGADEDNVTQPPTQSTEDAPAQAEPTPLEPTPSTSATPTSGTQETTKKKRATRSAAPRDPAAKKAPTAKKRQRKPKPSSQQDGEANDDEGEGSQTAPNKRRRKSTEDGGKARPRRARSITPEDAEDQVVDHQKLTMADLTRDLHIGKKFSRHDELRERERQARAKRKANRDDEGAEEDNTQESTTDSPNPNDTANRNQPVSGTSAAAEPQQGPGVQFRMVDGQIVLDQSSLLMDRHARAAANQQDMETIEENDFTRLITSNSFRTTSKLKGPNVWTADETAMFYRGLEMFGTDFEMISQMFPGKQRRNVKLKFNREERHNPKLIDAALIGPKKTMINMDEYKVLTGAVYETVESIEAQHREHEEVFEARQKALADEQAEIMRKKREELFADDDGTGAGAADDGGKKKKGKKRRPDPASLGDPEVIMGDM